MAKRKIMSIQLECDVCRSIDGVASYRIGLPEKMVGLELCKEHAKPLLELAKKGTQRGRARSSHTIEEIEALKRAGKA